MDPMRRSECGFCQVSEVVVEEGAPGLGRRADPRWPIASDRGVTDLDADLPEFRLDARRTPRRIRTPHVPDQWSYRWVDSWSTTPGPALPTPIGSESPAMPVHDRGRLNQDERLAPTGPEVFAEHARVYRIVNGILDAKVF